MTQAGKIFTIDNGSNDTLGGTPIFDAAGKPTNLVNNGGVGDQDTLNLLVDGAYYGHPVPNRANPTGSVIDYQHNITLANAASAVPAGAGVQAGFLIDPSKFTSVPHGSLNEWPIAPGVPKCALIATLLDNFLVNTWESHKYGSNRWYHLAGAGLFLRRLLSRRVVRQALGMKALHLGLAEYTATNFNGEMTGDLVTASFDGTIKRIDLAADGTTVLGVTTLAIPPGTPLDVTQGPGGSVWVTQIHSGQILVLTPSSTSATVDPDIDHDGILNIADPFQHDISNGTQFAKSKLSREM